MDTTFKAWEVTFLESVRQLGGSGEPWDGPLKNSLPQKFFEKKKLTIALLQLSVSRPLNNFSQGGRGAQRIMGDLPRL